MKDSTMEAIKGYMESWNNRKIAKGHQIKEWTISPDETTLIFKMQNLGKVHVPIEEIIKDAVQHVVIS